MRRAPLPVTIFFDTANNPQVADVRGRLVFDEVKDDGLMSFQYVGANGLARIQSPGVIFADLSNLDAAAFAMQLRGIDPHLRLIIDVHFPILEPEKVTAIVYGATEINADLDWEVKKYWANPQNLELALEVIRKADAITGPHAAWLQGLAVYNSKIVVLPDVNDARSGSRFFMQFLRAVSLAYSRPLSPWRRFLAWVALHSMARTLRIRGMK